MNLHLLKYHIVGNHMSRLIDVFPIQEMKRQAGVEVNEEEEELDYTEEEEDNGSSADNLQVFCCSATEYQKMKNISTDDGPPHVRH